MQTINEPITDDTRPGGKYFSLPVYGSKAALEVKPDATKKGIFTVRIEAATLISGTKQYNWENRITLQITRTDLIEFLLLSLGLKSSAHFKNYGANNDKFAQFSFQNEKYGPQVFVQVNQKNKPSCSLPISMAEMLQIGHLALCQYIKNFPGLSSEAALMSLSRLVQLSKK